MDAGFGVLADRASAFTCPRLSDSIPLHTRTPKHHDIANHITEAAARISLFPLRTSFPVHIRASTERPRPVTTKPGRATARDRSPMAHYDEATTRAVHDVRSEADPG